MAGSEGSKPKVRALEVSMAKFGFWGCSLAAHSAEDEIGRAILVQGMTRLPDMKGMKASLARFQGVDVLRVQGKEKILDSVREKPSLGGTHSGIQSQPVQALNQGDAVYPRHPQRPSKWCRLQPYPPDGVLGQGHCFDAGAAAIAILLRH